MEEERFGGVERFRGVEIFGVEIFAGIVENLGAVEKRFRAGRKRIREKRK